MPASLRLPSLLAVLAVLAVLAGLAGLGAPAARAQDALPSDPHVLVDHQEPCYAGRCTVQVTYDPAGAWGIREVQVAWTPDLSAPFAPEAVATCGVAAPPAPVSPLDPYADPVADATGVPEPCVIARMRARAAGTWHVVVQVLDVPSRALLSSGEEAVAVLERPGRRPAERPDRPEEADPVAALCLPQRSGEQCGPGYGRRTGGGGDKVPHAGWPAVTGILWKVLDSAPHRKAGGPANDELLGHHGSDRLSGAGGNDILWGDWDPEGNSARQRDVLRGGPGNDWLYPSHGASTVLGGPGNDHVWAFYGHGTIDCGPGRDTVRVRMNGAFRLRGCEVVQHFCAFGSDGSGGCRKPGHGAARRPPGATWRFD